MELIENIQDTQMTRLKIYLLKLVMLIIKQKGMQDLFFLMVHIMKGKINSLKLVVMEPKCFQTAQFILANGKIINWMEKENSFGLMEKRMMAKLNKTKKKDKGHILTRMENILLVNG